MNAHLAKIKEIALQLKELVPICYLRVIKSALDEIIAEIEALDKEMK